MYLEHFGLSEPPFSITPDPRFVYLSERHRDALAHLMFGITQGGGGGFVQLTGEVGTGKTTLSRLLLEQVPGNARVALVLNPRLGATELLETVCEELHLDVDAARGSPKALVDRLNAYLLEAYAEGLRVVLIIDEAQNLPTDALEQVRLLTNLETDTQKLLQVILIGQPELRDKLARPELRQLAQRITARFHLTPLDAAETADYMRHRHRVAGGQRFPFTATAVQRVHRHSGGVPRLTNVIAERALLAGYARDATLVDDALVDLAAAEALPPAVTRLPRRRRALMAAVLTAAVLAPTTAWWLASRATPDATTPAGVAGGTAVEPVPAAATPAPLPASTAPEVGPPLDGPALAARLAAPAEAPGPSWARLLALWELPATEADAAAAAQCAAVLAPGAYCVRGRANLDRLAAIGRPVLLRLHGSPVDHWALLLGTDARRVRLSLAGQAVDVERIALSGRWRGAYAAIWRGPEGLDPPLDAGADAAAWEWVRARLVPRYLGADASTAPPGGALAAAVRDFQRAHDLAPDGVVGPETLFALASGQPGPRLLEELP